VPLEPSTKSDVSSVWYREPWAWMVLAPLILVVISSSIMVSIAVIGADDVVSDNYYKEGRMLAQPSTSEEYARSINLQGQVLVDPETQELHLSLSNDAWAVSQHEGADDAVADAFELELLVSHPAYAERDQRYILSELSPRRFRTDLVNAIEGRWYLRLTARRGDHELWRLHGELDTAVSRSIELN